MHQDPMVETAVEKVHVYSWDWEYNGVEKRNFLRWNTLQTYKADPKLACRFYEWLEKIFSSMVRVGIGCHSMNPFPCFMLTHVAPGWVGGILSCAERTYWNQTTNPRNVWPYLLQKIYQQICNLRVHFQIMQASEWVLIAVAPPFLHCLEPLVCGKVFRKNPKAWVCPSESLPGTGAVRSQPHSGIAQKFSCNLA